MSYLDLFQRYGSPSREASVQIRDYLIRPDVLTADRIASYDQSAARTIAECRQLIDQLTEYRQALEYMEGTETRHTARRPGVSAPCAAEIPV